jgi:DNA-binding IclR family transcriptional regulator
MVARLGQRSPVHCTASGQVLIAELPETSIDDVIQRHGLKKYTPFTITNPARFKKRLREVHAQGFSIADAEYKSDLCAIAAPIRDHRGRVCAALMTAMQSERARRNKQQVNQIVAILKKESAVISREIGYAGLPESVPLARPEGA